MFLHQIRQRFHALGLIESRVGIALSSLIGLLAFPVTFILALVDDIAVMAALAAVGFLLMCINVATVRFANFSLWPTRIATLIGLVMLAYNIALGLDTIVVVWPICLPPILFFLYKRIEGLVWTLALATLCGFAISTLPISFFDRHNIEFFAAYLLSTLFAFGFETVRSRASTAEQSRSKELKFQEMRARDFAEIGSDWLFELNEKLEFIYLPKNWDDKVPLQALFGQSITLLSESCAIGHTQELDDLFVFLTAKKPFRDHRIVLRMPAGNATISLSGKPLSGADGRFTGYRGIGSDISAIVESELELREKDRTLQQAQKMETIGQLTSGIAHDFNNILTVVIGNLDLLQLRLEQHNVDATYLRTALAASNKAAELTAKLLSFGRRQALLPEVVDPTKLANDVADILRRTLGKQVSITVTPNRDHWLCFVDAGQLESAIINLAINARDAMPNGGRLAIDIDMHEITTPITNSELPVGEYVCITVKDTGTGISEELLAHVFEPFFSTKPISHGTGLGLSMVYGFVKQSGGDVIITSQVGEGTSVKLFLPRSTATPKEIEKLAPATQVASCRILVVEDDEPIRRLTKAMLTRLGHTVDTAGDVTHGLQLFSEFQPDVLLVDVVLAGGESGIKLAAELLDLSPTLSVLLMSGYADPILDTPDKLAARLPLLKKPFDTQDLAQALVSVIPHQPTYQERSLARQSEAVD